LYGKQDTRVLLSLESLVKLYKKTNNNEALEALLNNIVSINESSYGQDHPDTATSLNNLALLYYNTDRYLEAEPLYKRVLAIREKALGPENPDTATSHSNLALLYEITSRYSEAEPLFKRALAIREKALGPEHPDTGISLNNLAGLYQTTGRYAEAEPLYKRALIIFEKVPGPEHSDTASILDSLAGLYSTTGRYAEAEPLFKRALAIREKALGPEHPDTGISLNNLALHYYETGRYAEAEPLYKRALIIFEKVPGPEHSDTASILDNLARLYKTNGRYAEAEPLFKRALAIREKALGPEHPDTGISLNNLAGQFQTTGRYAEAEPLYKRALALYEKILPEHHDTGSILNNLAKLYMATDRYTKAEPLYLKALSIYEKALGPDHPEMARSFNNLAEMYFFAGRFSEAEPLNKRALAIREKALGPEHPVTSISINNLACLYYTTGNYAESEPLYQLAIRITSNFDIPSSAATSLNNYSYLLSSQSNPLAAIFFAKQAVNISQSLRQNVFMIGRDELNSFDKTLEDRYQRLAELLIEQGRFAEAQQVLAMLKEDEYFGFIRRDSSAANKLTTRASYIATEEPWLREYEAISSSNAKLGKEIGELKNKAKYYPLTETEKSRLDVLMKEDVKATAVFNDFLARLIKGMKEEARTDPDRLEDIGAKGLKTLTTLKSTLKSLGEGSVLLHYLITADKVHILLTTPDIQLARHSIIKAADLNKKIFALRDAVSNPKLDPRPQAKELYDILLAPVMKDLEASQAKTLMLSLDGALRYLPFGVLHNGTTYVAENYRTVMYAEAARDKVVLPAKAQWKVAALGVSDKVHADFSALPNVPGELNGIVKSNAGGVIPGEIRLNKNFTEASMNETSLRNPVVHIASHFKFAPGTDRDSFLLLGDGSTMSLDKLRNGSFFQESELLTLSACETAMGTTGKGIEIEGFGAIAMNQGAKSVIATLWPVSDNSTAMLMKEFYRLKEEKKLPKVEALRQAQLALLNGTIQATTKESSPERGSDRKRYSADTSKPYSHPYYWAPFILMGNWK